jgi:LmbE family N-acetylglucosaminyl deacetylase
MKVLAIGLDPIDLIIAAGGTLARYAKRGDEVHAVLVRTSELAEEDFARASAAFGDLGVTLHPTAVVPAIRDERGSRDSLMDTIRRVSPEVIIGPSDNSIRPAECELARLVFGAAYCACVPNYPSPGGVEASSIRPVILHTDPTLGFRSGTPEYVDIEDAWEAKQSAIARYPDAETHLAAAEALGGARGVQVQCERAEAFGQEPVWGRLRPMRVLP